MGERNLLEELKTALAKADNGPFCVSEEGALFSSVNGAILLNFTTCVHCERDGHGHCIDNRTMVKDGLNILPDLINITEMYLADLDYALNSARGTAKFHELAGDEGLQAHYEFMAQHIEKKRDQVRSRLFTEEEDNADS